MIASFSRKYYKEILIAVIIFFFFYFLSQVNYNELLHHISSHPLLIGKILIATTVAYFCATWAWYYSFPVHSRNTVPNLLQLFVIRQIGESVCLITPANVIGGEASKAALLNKFGISSADAINSVIVSRLFIIISYFLLFFIVGSILMIQQHLAFILVPISLSGIGIILYNFALSEIAPVKHLDHKLQSLLSKKYLKFKAQINHLRKQIKSQKRDSFKALSLSALHWLIGVLEFYFILNALGIQCSYSQALLLEIGVMVFKSAGAFIPGQIGVEELGNKFMLGIIGITSLEIWITVSIIRRTRQLTWIGLSLILAGTIINYKLWKFSL